MLDNLFLKLKTILLPAKDFKLRRQIKPLLHK